MPASRRGAQGSETTLQITSFLGCCFVWERTVQLFFFLFFEPATATLSSPREAADSDRLSAFTV